MSPRIFDHSLRYKIPLWGSMLIAVAALTLSLSFMAQAYDDLKRDMLANSENLGHILIKTLYSSMLHDDVWRAFEIVRAPYKDTPTTFRAEGLIVLNAQHEVFVSSQPDAWPMRSQVGRLGPAYAKLSGLLKTTPEAETISVEADHAILLALPIIADDVGIGHLILVHPANFYWPRFQQWTLRAVLITALVLSVLLPINWYWGRRIASPVLQLTERMDELGKRHAGTPLSSDYPYRDELGSLFQTYDRMLTELTEKKELERQVVKSDRLAALGRLSAGIAHEINNPLGGLFTALDTLKRYAAPDPVLDRVSPLLERGLAQIRDIVAALLVEAKAQSHAFAARDIDDVQTLLAQEAKERGVAWAWEIDLRGDASLPATPVRQVLINLILNALQAAGKEGRVTIRIVGSAAGLSLMVENDGADIPASLMENLYEPFTGLNQDGHGLGLWITHQIVEQLHGRITVTSRDGRTRFSVELPAGETQ